MNIVDNLMQKLHGLWRLTTPGTWFYQKMFPGDAERCYVRVGVQANNRDRTVFDSANTDLLNIEDKNGQVWDLTAVRNFEFITAVHAKLPELATQFAAMNQWISAVMRQPDRFTNEERTQAAEIKRRIASAI